MTDIPLDPEQQKVVDSTDSIVVDASPGSGKTRVLTEKARKLIDQGQNILCLCFTRAAASEMSARVPHLPATTIHSFCYQAIGWKVPSGGTDDDGYQYLLHRFVRDNDMVFDWILIDECQDLNPEEMDTVLSLVGGKIFAVGDVLQSIYGFQGAMGPSIVDLLKRLGCRELSLKNNYRSSQNVVDRLNSWYARELVSMGPKDTGLTAILCRRNDDVFEVSNHLKTKGVPHRIRLSAALSQHREWDVLGKSKLRLMTVHSSKGQEFDNVIIYNWYPDDFEEEERVYYVAMSRAAKEIMDIPNLGELLKAI